LQPEIDRLVLNRIIVSRGAPTALRCDNGTEFTATAFDQWAYWNHVQIDYSRPGKPTDNAFIESFNGRVRQELLNGSWFPTIEAAGEQHVPGGVTTTKIVRTDR
jgi:putative transposase